MALQRERLAKEAQQILAQVYTALRVGAQEEADELRTRHRDLELQLERLAREENKAKALQRARARQQAARAATSAGSSTDVGTVALPVTELELNNQVACLQQQLDRARLDRDLEAAVELRKAMEHVELRREQLFRPPLQTTRVALPWDKEKQSGTEHKKPQLRHRAAPRQGVRVLCVLPPDAVGEGSSPGAIRFFAMMAELEAALGEQDFLAAKELRRRLGVFLQVEEFQQLAAASKLRGKKLQALKVELDKALDGHDPDAVWETWRRLKVASAFQRDQLRKQTQGSEQRERRQQEPRPVSLPVGLDGDAKRAAASGAAVGAEPAEDMGTEASTEALSSCSAPIALPCADASLEEELYSEANVEDQHLVEARAKVRGHAASLRQELAMIEWSLSVLLPDEEDEGERQKLLARQGDIEAEVAELHKAL